MRVGGADHDRISRNPAKRLDFLSGSLDQPPPHRARVYTHQSNRRLPIVKYRYANLTGIMEPIQVRFSVASRLFHSKFGCDVPLGEAGFKRLGDVGIAAHGERCRSSRRTPRHPCSEKVSAFHKSTTLFSPSFLVSLICPFPGRVTSFRSITRGHRTRD